MSGFARRHKYGAQPTIIDGVRFASRKEATRYAQLKLQVQAGAIRNLVLQPRYPLLVGGQKIATYVADFSYDTPDGPVIEDVKGVETDVFKLKMKLFRVCHPELRVTIIR